MRERRENEKMRERRENEKMRERRENGKEYLLQCSCHTINFYF